MLKTFSIHRSHTLASHEGYQQKIQSFVPQSPTCTLSQHLFVAVLSPSAAHRSHTLASHEGYQYIEFWTDGGRELPISCGAPPPGGKCEVINSGKVPSWHKATQKGAKWFKDIQIYHPNTYYLGGKYYEKATHFDVDENEASTSGGHGAERNAPQYYREVFPLSELKGTCNSAGTLSRLESACWNKHYRYGWVCWC